MNRLLNIGFINVGHWTLINNLIKYNLSSHELTKNILYSFVTNGVVNYIGKTSMHLSKRMYGYQNPGPSQTTNIRVNKKIKDILLSNQPVDIFILVSNGLLKYGNFRINLAAGLEDTLIFEISPEWNFSGKNKIKEDEESCKEEFIRIDKQLNFTNSTLETFEVSLGRAYYSQGFFNVKQNNAENFSVDKSIIEVQLGNNPENTIQGYIDRTSNPNGTPRIMIGKPYTDWIQNNFKQGDILEVDIKSPTSIKLNEKRKTI